MWLAYRAGSMLWLMGGLLASRCMLGRALDEQLAAKWQVVQFFAGAHMWGSGSGSGSMLRLVSGPVTSRHQQLCTRVQYAVHAWPNSTS